MTRLKVLVACESSGVVSQAFRDLGHMAWSCDILPKDGPDQRFHIEGDVLHVLNNSRPVKATDAQGTTKVCVPFKNWKWDLMIAHPPCTFLCNSGVRWLISHYNVNQGFDEDAEETIRVNKRWDNMEKAAQLFARLWLRDIPHIAIENPIMHRHGAIAIAKYSQLHQPKIKATQFIQPWQFGHGETKATGLYLKNLPKLVPTNIVAGREQRVWKMPPGPNRWKERSKTFEGIAKAMATQWSAHIIAEKQKACSHDGHYPVGNCHECGAALDKKGNTSA